MFTLISVNRILKLCKVKLKTKPFMLHVLIQLIRTTLNSCNRIYTEYQKVTIVFCIVHHKNGKAIFIDRLKIIRFLKEYPEKYSTTQ